MIKIPENYFYGLPKRSYLGNVCIESFSWSNYLFLFHSIVLLLLRCTQRIIGFQQLPSTEPVEGENCHLQWHTSDVGRYA